MKISIIIAVIMILVAVCSAEVYYWSDPACYSVMFDEKKICDKLPPRFLIEDLENDPIGTLKNIKADPETFVERVRNNNGPSGVLLEKDTFANLGKMLKVPAGYLDALIEDPNGYVDDEESKSGGITGWLAEAVRDAARRAGKDLTGLGLGLDDILGQTPGKKAVTRLEDFKRRIQTLENHSDCSYQSYENERTCDSAEKFIRANKYEGYLMNRQTCTRAYNDAMAAAEGDKAKEEQARNGRDQCNVAADWATKVGKQI